MHVQYNKSQAGKDGMIFTCIGAELLREALLGVRKVRLAEAHAGVAGRRPRRAALRPIGVSRGRQGGRYLRRHPAGLHRVVRHRLARRLRARMCKFGFPEILQNS
jgi:hypothetical protein